MYCPSCDKSYGAIHSRCPECHSWLKVSAPSSQRSKGGKMGGAPSSVPQGAPDENRSVVGTMDRGSSVVGWADPEPSGAWSDPPSADSSGGWSTGDLGAPASPSPVPPVPVAPPKTEEWADTGNGWGGESSPSPSRKPASNGWLDSGGGDDGWSGGGGLAAEPPVTAKAAPPAKAKGWLGDPEPVSPPAGGHSQEASGWLGNSAGAPTSPKAPSGSGWLGEGADRAEAGGGGGGGWLGDSASHATPSMAEMVDHAIGVQEDDDFVDDSWVDEEIRDNEFDDLDVPEFMPSSPEAGGVFLKMLLVAILVVLVGGGVMFLRSDSKTPEQIAAEATEKRLSFGRLAAEGGKTDLAAGKATLAIPQFEEALVALSEGKAPQTEIYDTEVLLGRALMSAKEYEEAFKHWKSLKSSGQEKYVAEANKGLADTKRQLRITANEYLKEAKQYASKGEINSVKRLGKDALDIYKSYGGDQGQIGNAHGIIGRGFMNGREYAVARDHLKKAVTLAPKLGYQTLLAEVNRELQPDTYIPPIQYQQQQSYPAQQSAPARSADTPSFDLGSPSYQTNNRSYSGGGRSSGSSSNNNASSSGAPAAAPKTMKEIPIYRPSQRGSSGNQRPGSKGVLQGY